MNFKMTPQKLMIAMFTIVLLAVPIATLVLPKQTRSENENRTLATFPTLVNESKMEKAENFADWLGAIRWSYITERKRASYMDDLETYFSDHVAGRESWVIASNTLEKLSGKQEINGVFTVDDKMILTFKSYDKENVQKSLDALSGFAKRMGDTPVYFMLAPTAQEMNTASMPSYGGYLSEKAFIDECYKNVSGVNTIDCLSFLSGHKDEYIFYRTDHHWTSLGAYYGYCSAAKSLGYSAYGLSAFNIETASSSFRGTLYSKTLDNGVTPDSIDYYHLAAGDPSLKMSVNDGTTVTEYDDLYVRSYLDTKDKYASFTGTNTPIIDIETDIDNAKSLLLIKDSYAHSLVPFLSKHYSRITMVDLRYINAGLDAVVDLDSYSQVLVMYNAVTFADDLGLKKLAFIKD